MSLEISRDTETRLNGEAQKQGISVDALLERFMDELAETAPATDTTSRPELPVLHLGPMGALHRREIYDDVR